MSETNPPPEQPLEIVRRPMNSFILFSNMFRAQVAEQTPDKAQVSRILGYLWNNLTPLQKQPFEERAQLLRDQHRVDNPGYVYSSKVAKENKREKTRQLYTTLTGKILDYVYQEEDPNESKVMVYVTTSKPPNRIFRPIPLPIPTPSPKASPDKKKTKKGKLKLSDAKIGFIGAGKIADSIIRGLITYAKIDTQRIYVSAKTTKNLETFKQKGCHVTKRNYDIFAKYDCDIVFLCFHGSVIKQCYKIGGSRPAPFTTFFIPNHKHPIYVLSLVNGVTLDQIKACLLNPEHPEKYMLEMHRIMLNSAVAYGLGLGAVDVESDGKKCSPIIRDLLTTISKLEYIPEPQMDAACALGGSGLAFTYYYISALADGAIKMGLSRQISIKFAVKTAQCAALTLLESGKHGGELKDSCTSPSGAAIYGIHVLDKADVLFGIAGAVEAAHKRAKEIAEQEVNE